MIGENLAIIAVMLGVIVSGYTIRNNIKKDQQERTQERKSHERRHENVEQRIKKLEEAIRLIQLDHSLLKEDTKVKKEEVEQDESVRNYIDKLLQENSELTQVKKQELEL